MVGQVGTFAGLYLRATLHSSAKIRCPLAQRESTSRPFLPDEKMPHGCKVFNYDLTVVHVASRCKEAEPLTSKESAAVAKAFQKIYKRRPLKWPQLLQGAVTKEVEKIKLRFDAGALTFRTPVCCRNASCR